jgi:hypothetical protein
MISSPSMDDFETMIRTARQQAIKAGMKRSAIKKAVAEVRGSRSRVQSRSCADN